MLALLKTDEQRGLTEIAARERLDKYGKMNFSRKSRPRDWKQFLAQFQDVLVILLLIATAISLRFGLSSVSRCPTKR